MPRVVTKKFLASGIPGDYLKKWLAILGLQVSEP